MNRLVLTASLGPDPRFRRNAARLHANLCALQEPVLWWDDSNWPPEAPADPYGFKVTALELALQRRYTQVLWLDSSIVVLKPLAPIWDAIERDGYWLARNMHDPKTGEWTDARARWPMNSDWTDPRTLPALGVTAKENAQIPQVVGGAFGLDLGCEPGVTVLRELKRMLIEGAFQGPREIHRHDQTCLSVIAWKLALALNEELFADGGKEGAGTMLASYRA